MTCKRTDGPPGPHPGILAMPRTARVRGPRRSSPAEPPSGPSRPVQVLRFGENCLQDGADYARAAGIVAAGTGPRVVVVSAAEGIHDLIVAGIEKARIAEQAAAEALSHVRSRHRTLAGGLGLRTEIQWELHRDLETMLRKLEKLLLGVSFTGEVSPPTRSR